MQHLQGVYVQRFVPTYTHIHTDACITLVPKKYPIIIWNNKILKMNALVLENQKIIFTYWKGTLQSMWHSVILHLPEKLSFLYIIVKYKA